VISVSPWADKYLIMDQYCHYIETKDSSGNIKSNGSVFIVEHNQQSLLLTAAHTLRRYNDFIFPDFPNWHADHITLNEAKVSLYRGRRQPLFRVYLKNHRELLDAAVLPYDAPGGPIDFDYRPGDAVKLCGWRKTPEKTKFILDSEILDVKNWDMRIDLSKHAGLERSGISGGGVYTERGFVGIYFADDIGKPTSHAVCLRYLFK
jgi:hypothetical protein